MIVFDLGNGKYDKIYTESGGSGGSTSNVQFSMFNEESILNIELISIRSLQDSVSISLRKRYYDRVSELCYELLTDYIDSLEDASLISKLYLSELRQDSSGNKISNLKTILESLILNNPDKESFIKQSFYVIQKCKVSLGLYQSAMSGFQEIINQNPYSYEGLVASWDFSATSLLYGLHGGSGGGITNYKFQITNDDSNSNIDDDPSDKYDLKKFTKEDRKIIKENVINSFQTSREIEIEKVKSLEKKVSEGNASKTERSELKVKKTLGEVIKVNKPRDIAEHIYNVNNNIQKVFGSTKDHNSKEVINIIPIEYSLSQNYPNPFNPVTHLEFGISDLGFVSLKVYDVLDREIKTLINEIKPAGTYKIEFDGSNFASGVYFYKL